MPEGVWRSRGPAELYRPSRDLAGVGELAYGPRELESTEECSELVLSRVASCALWQWYCDSVD